MVAGKEVQRSHLRQRQEAKTIQEVDREYMLSVGLWGWISSLKAPSLKAPQPPQTVSNPWKQPSNSPTSEEHSY